MKNSLKSILVVLLGILILNGCSKKEDVESKIEINKDVIKNQEVEVFKFKNTSLNYENGISTFETTVTNTSDEKKELVEFTITFKDEDGNVIISLPGFVGSVLNPKETKIISSSCGEDLTKASSVEYSIVK